MKKYTLIIIGLLATAAVYAQKPGDTKPGKGNSNARNHKDSVQIAPHGDVPVKTDSVIRNGNQSPPTPNDDRDNSRTTPNGDTGTKPTNNADQKRTNNNTNNPNERNKPKNTNNANPPAEPAGPKKTTPPPDNKNKGRGSSTPSTGNPNAPQ